MALQDSGTISAADINNELGRSSSSSFSMDGSEERNLAGVGSGTISMSDFHGASDAMLSATLTVGSWTPFSETHYGYSEGDGGDLSPNITSDGYEISQLAYNSYNGGQIQLQFAHLGNEDSVPFNSLEIEGHVFYRSDAETFFSDTGGEKGATGTYSWSTSNIIGTNTGSTKTVTILK